MNLSFGEFGALAAKAFRGAGYSWGLTEDASFAVSRLAEFSGDAGPATARLLRRAARVDPVMLMPNEQWQSGAGFLCPICVGVTIVDSGECSDLELAKVVVPALLTPFLGMLATESISFAISWDGGDCGVDQSSIVVSGSAPAAPAKVSISRQTRTDQRAVERLGRVVLDEPTQAALHGFAHRTYAPATEQSRESGAGAGHLDAD